MAVETNLDTWKSWIKKPNVAEYDDADWSKEIMRKSGLTLDEAMKIAAGDPKVTFFFYMRENMILPKHGQFKPGDAVFFSGEPWYGSAPQADAYEKATFEWAKKPNVAQYDEADWSKEVMRKSGLTLDEAMKIGAGDSRVTFFFYMKEYMVLPKHGQFKPGDAVFFAGEPWYGSAPQSDAYEKTAVKWTKTPNVAEYDGADWGEYIRRQNVTLEEAMKIGAEDPRVTFFFYMKDGMYLPVHGAFNPKEAVFFYGKPWFGSAPQADSYIKEDIPAWKL